MKRLFFTIFVFLLAAFLVSPAIAADREKMTINELSSHTIKGYSGSNVDITGDDVQVNEALTQETYYYESTSGTTLTWAYSYGNFLSISGTTATVVLLPAITAAKSGYILYVKNVSGDTTRTMTPSSGVDAIESTQGTMTGSSCAKIDAAGDHRTWIAVYSSDTSGASSVWMLINNGCSD